MRGEVVHILQCLSAGLRGGEEERRHAGEQRGERQAPSMKENREEKQPHKKPSLKTDVQITTLNPYLSGKTRARTPARVRTRFATPADWGAGATRSSGSRRTRDTAGEEPPKSQSV